MAFEVRDLSLLAYTGAADGYQMWAYPNEAEDTVTDAGFFNGAAGMLRTGDTIYVVNTGITYRVTSDTGATPVAVAANYDTPGGGD